MKHRNSHLLVGYWSRLRKGRDVPDQTDIDPRAIKRMLSFVFIIDASDMTRPMYRLAGTSLCDRFGLELKGSNFLSHWDGQSRTALATLLRQSLATKQPICLSSIGATSDHGMVEMETILAPVSFGPGQPLRFIGLVQVLSDQTPLAGKPIAYQRLVGSQLVREDEPLTNLDIPPPPMPPMITNARPHPRAPHLRLVVSQTRPVTLHCDLDSPMQRLIQALDILALPVERTA